MSEEEIIRRIHLLSVIHDDLVTDEDRVALQKILYLYKKEKEKNKKQRGIIQMLYDVIDELEEE